MSTLANFRAQVERNLMDTTNLVWPTTILEEALRAALADISRAYDEQLFVSGLDGAATTTIAVLDYYVLVKGAVAHALIFRTVGRYEEATPEPALTPQLAALAHQRMQEFWQYLMPIYTAQGTPFTDEDYYIWQSAENLLDRQHATALQDALLTWRAAESVLDRAHKVSESALERALKEGLQDDLLLWKAAESVLDRAHKVSEAALDRALKVSEAALERTHKTDLQIADQVWQTSEAVLDRAMKVSEAALDRAAKADLQTAAQDWKTLEAALNRAHQLALLQAKADREDALAQAEVERLESFQKSDVAPYSPWATEI